MNSPFSATLRFKVSELASYASCDRCIQRFWRDGEDLAAADHRGKRTRTRYRANRAFAGLSSLDVSAQLPLGTFQSAALRLSTEPFTLGSYPEPVVVSGELPVPLKLATGGFALIRPSTATRSEFSSLFVARQLHAYALLAEDPKNVQRGVHPIAQLWVAWCRRSGDSVHVQLCERIARDDDWFLSDLTRITDLIGTAANAPPSVHCTRCT